MIVAALIFWSPVTVTAVLCSPATVTALFWSPVTVAAAFLLTRWSDIATAGGGQGWRVRGLESWKVNSNPLIL